MAIFAPKYDDAYMIPAKKIAFHTLGCKLNFSETSTLARQFEGAGYVRAAKGERADVCVINTCSVTGQADKKCRNLINRLIRENPRAVIAVTGCYAQLKAAEIAAIEGVDLVVGNNDKGSLLELVKTIEKKGDTEVQCCGMPRPTSFFPSFSSGERTRAFLKVQDGCDYACSYCTIPLARGASRNISVEELVGEAEQIAAAGRKEIVLTGVNTGDFGRSTGETFLQLITRLDRIEGIERYRISSIEPNLLTPQIIDFTACSEKFQPHFHIPLQSGTDKILKRMRRRYTTQQFAEKIGMLRERIPGVFIGIDVIVGFPGETEDDFWQTYDLLAGLKPGSLHIFPYSERPDTPAVHFDGKVSSAESARRAAVLKNLNDRLHGDFCRRFIGKEAQVLVEGTKKGGWMFGYTGNYIKAEIPYRKELINRIVDVRLDVLQKDGTVSASLPESVTT